MFPSEHQKWLSQVLRHIMRLVQVPGLQVENDQKCFAWECRRTKIFFQPLFLDLSKPLSKTNSLRVKTNFLAFVKRKKHPGERKFASQSPTPSPPKPQNPSKNATKHQTNNKKTTQTSKKNTKLPKYTQTQLKPQTFHPKESQTQPLFPKAEAQASGALSGGFGLGDRGAGALERRAALRAPEAMADRARSEEGGGLGLQRKPCFGVFIEFY